MEHGMFEGLKDRLIQQVSGCADRAVRCELVAVIESSEPTEKQLLRIIDCLVTHLNSTSDTYIAKAIQAIQAQDPICPTDKRTFLRWIVAQFKSKRKEMTLIKKMVDQLQRRVRLLRDELSACRTPQKSEPDSQIHEEVIPPNCRSSSSVTEELQSTLAILKAENSRLSDSVQHLTIAIQNFERDNSVLSSNLAKATSKLKAFRDIDRETHPTLSELSRKNEALPTALASPSEKVDTLSPHFTSRVEALKQINDSLSADVAAQQSKIGRLQSELAVREADILRLRESSGISEKATIGFLIADAICDHFNPRFCDDELKRLITEVNRQHIELTGTLRVMPEFCHFGIPSIPRHRAALFERCV
jgi:predicted RNase H-like nuclease (RuvC/YqgF family)